MISRPDLAMLQPIFPEGFIGSRVFPPLVRPVREGKLYYRALTSAGAAQTNRARVAAPTRDTLAPTKVDWAAAEYIRGEKIDIADVGPNRGDLLDLEGSLRVSALAKLISVGAAVEQAAADTLFACTANTPIDGSSDVIGGIIISAKNAIREYHGRRILVAGRDTLLRMLQLEEILDAQSVVTDGIPLDDALTASTLKRLLGLDDIWVGDPEYWGGSGTAGHYGKAALIAMPNLPAGIDMATMLRAEPLFGVTAIYNPYDGSPEMNGVFASVQQGFDDHDRIHILDVVAHLEHLVLNETACVVIEDIVTAPTTTAAPTTTTGE